MEPWERGPGPDLSGGEIGVRLVLLLVACAGIGIGVLTVLWGLLYSLPFIFFRDPGTGMSVLDAGVLALGVGFAALLALGVVQLVQRRRA